MSAKAKAEESKVTLDQRRALDAFECAQEAQGTRDAGRYRAYVESLPAAILTNGLGQALASERANAGDRDSGGSAGAHLRLYNNLTRWLRGQIVAYQEEGDFLQALMTQDESHYLHAQAEALAWLGWHKKFCRAFIERAEEDR